MKGGMARCQICCFILVMAVSSCWLLDMQKDINNKLEWMTEFGLDSSSSNSLTKINEVEWPISCKCVCYVDDQGSLTSAIHSDQLNWTCRWRSVATHTHTDCIQSTQFLSGNLSLLMVVCRPPATGHTACRRAVPNSRVPLLTRGISPPTINPSIWVCLCATVVPFC